MYSATSTAPLTRMMAASSVLEIVGTGIAAGGGSSAGARCEVPVAARIFRQGGIKEYIVNTGPFWAHWVIREVVTCSASGELKAPRIRENASRLEHRHP